MSVQTEADDCIFDAKQKLYNLMLQKDWTKLSENDINIMHHLSIDESVQKLFKEEN